MLVQIRRQSVQDLGADFILYGTLPLRACDTAADPSATTLWCPLRDDDLHNYLTIQLAKNSTGDYYENGGPFSAMRTPMLWGKPVALTTAITLGTALVGAFKYAAQFFRKGGIRVDVSNSHSDFFVKNLVAIRAEERGILTVRRPGAYGLVTGLN